MKKTILLILLFGTSYSCLPSHVEIETSHSYGGSKNYSPELQKNSITKNQ